MRCVSIISLGDIPLFDPFSSPGIHTKDFNIPTTPASFHHRIGHSVIEHTASEEQTCHPAQALAHATSSPDRSLVFEPNNMFAPKAWLKTTPPSLDSGAGRKLISHAATTQPIKTTTHTRHMLKKEIRQWRETTSSTQHKSASVQGKSVDAKFLTKQRNNLELHVGKDNEHSRTWRPDRDEMCSTTTTIRRGSDGMVAVGHLATDTVGKGITITRKFEWNETWGG